METSLPAHDLVLVGAGHTNMHIARMWRMEPIPDVRLTLVSAFSRATYSGMLPGTLAGLYTPDDMEIDLRRFCGERIRLIVDDAIGLDPDRRRITLRNRPPIRYDVASVGIGSVPTAVGLDGENPSVLSIKPMPTFLHRLDAQLGSLLSGATNHDPLVRVVVVGGGAAGVEIAFCLDGLFRRRSINASVVLIDSGPRILSSYLAKTSELARREAQRRGIDILSNSRVAEFERGHLKLTDDRSVDADLVILATSAQAPAELDGFAIPKSDDGFLAVRPTLQSTGNDRVFVVGDTATIVDNPVPKAGVYAVREGPVLWENIRRTFHSDTPVDYEPQRDFLSLLSTGDGRAIGQFKGFAAHGRWVWRWKDRIDRRFMRMYQDYRTMSESMALTERPKPTGGAPTMQCRGCGGKVGAGVLSAALDRLGVTDDGSTRIGLSEPDDAAIIDAKSSPVEVLSVDFFKSFLDDPFLVGRVAALNALSDVWAMGAAPTGAMAMVAIPDGAPGQQVELLYQLLAGGLRELDHAGATLLGGHTIAGSDLTIGYTVVGNLNDRVPFAKSGLREGDCLVLTRPLGTGLLLAAHGENACRATWIDTMLETMLASNRAASAAGREFDVVSATDVTGFGLAGHLSEMLEASGTSAEISLSAVPVLPGLMELSGAGFRSTLDPANRELVVPVRPATPELLASPKSAALFDPQTSGGMLIAVRPEQSQELVGRLHDSGSVHAAVVGRVVASGEMPEMRLIE